jgi:hypothetical protein
MNVLKNAAQNLKAIGFGAAVPGLRDQILNTITGDASKAQDEKIKALEAEVAAGKKTKEQAQMEAQQRANQGMKAGGRVKSASARADGCAVRGKTRA